MTKTKRRFVLVTSGILAIAAGCMGTDTLPDRESSSGTDGSTPDVQGQIGADGSIADAGSDGARPTLGTQLDRVGRPGISSPFGGLLIGAFEADTEAARAAYRSDSDEAAWVAKYGPAIANSIPLYDGLTACGDQFLCNKPPLYDVDASTIPAESAPYASLAVLLADDRLWLNTEGEVDNRYLALELNLDGRPFNSGAGGRRLSFDVIDSTLSNLVYNDSIGYTDQAEPSPDKVIPSAAFPFVVDPVVPDGSVPERPPSTVKPEAQLNDLFAFIDTPNIVFLTTVYPIAPAGARFATDVEYVLHTESGTSLGATKGAVDIMCTFDAAQIIQCWAGDEYVTGDANVRAGGIVSASKRLRVYAGLSADPTFANFLGIRDGIATLKAVSDAALSHDAGCPLLDTNTRKDIVNRFKSDGDGGHGEDFFVNLNALALVIEVDPSIVTTNGKVVSAWASTNAKP